MKSSALVATRNIIPYQCYCCKSANDYSYSILQQLLVSYKYMALHYLFYCKLSLHLTSSKSLPIVASYAASNRGHGTYTLDRLLREGSFLCFHSWVLAKFGKPICSKILKYNVTYRIKIKYLLYLTAILQYVTYKEYVNELEIWIWIWKKKSRDHNKK